MFGKLFKRSTGKSPKDEFELLDLCDKVGLHEHSDVILKACRRAVEVNLEEFTSELPHTASRLGGHPALPDDFPWPLGQNGAPMHFLGQLTCQELRLARYDKVPEEGLLSVFLDTIDEQPEQAHTFYFSLKRDLIKRSPPGGIRDENPSYRPGFYTIPSLPALDSKDFESLNFKEEARESYEELLDLLSLRRDPSSIQVGGYPPLWHADSTEAETEPEQSQFFLSLHDIEELSIGWEPTGTIFLWIPNSEITQAEIPTRLVWQVCEDDEDWDDDEDEDSDEED